MIYIPFFIVILIDKRDDKRDDTQNVHRTYTAAKRETETEQKKGMTPPTQHHTTAHHR